MRLIRKNEFELFAWLDQIVGERSSRLEDDVPVKTSNYFSLTELICSLPFGVVGVTTSLVIGVIFDLECESSSAGCRVCFMRRLWRVVRPPVSKSRSSRWPERDRVSCRWTYSSKSSSSRLLIKQFNTIRNIPNMTANRPVATNSFHHVIGLPARDFHQIH